MPQNVAVVFVHGISVSNYNFHVPMRDRLIRKIPRDLRSYIQFQPVFWADLVRNRQQDYMLQTQCRSPIKDSSFRRLVLEGLGDAAAYQKTRSRRNSAYYDIQGRIRDRISEIDNPESPSRPLIFVGHSLGCHIISSFVWDINTIKQYTDDDLDSKDNETKDFAGYLRSTSPFQRLDTFAGFVTLGSNMPLFTFTFGPHRVVPITCARKTQKDAAFPGRGLDETTRERARWLNFYSPNDLLGYPLKPLNEIYAREDRLTDTSVCSEGFLMSLIPSPLNTQSAHVGYWRNRRVIKDTAKLITDVITACDRDDVPLPTGGAVSQTG